MAHGGQLRLAGGGQFGWIFQIHLHETGKTFPNDLKVSEAEYDRIKKFRVYMDSLARSPAGKIIYDSIVSNRPGLMDSVAFLENYYGQLKQKQEWKRK